MNENFKNEFCDQLNIEFDKMSIRNLNQSFYVSFEQFKLQNSKQFHTGVRSNNDIVGVLCPLDECRLCCGVVADSRFEFILFIVCVSSRFC